MPKLNTVSDRIFFAKIALLNLALFLLVYGTTNHLLHESSSFQPYFSWEKSIPFVDWMIIPYMSLNLIFLIPLFFLTKSKLKVLDLAFVMSTICAGIFFVIFPFTPEFTRVIPSGITSTLYRHLYILDNPKNLFPSLHVTYSTLYFLSCFTIFKSSTGRIIFGVWITLIIVSTLFTHQHHIIDIVSGISLGGVTYLISSKIFPGEYKHLAALAQAQSRV